MDKDTRITAPVTTELLQELVNTEELIKTYNDPNARLKDLEHYGPIALQLEALAKAVLIAQASVPLLTPRSPGARFHVHTNGSVSQGMGRTMSYLSNEAANLMSNNGSALSRYDKNYTLSALGLLSELSGRIKDEIRQLASYNLSRIASAGVEVLVATADVVSKIEAGDVQGLSAYAEAAGKVDVHGTVRKFVAEDGDDVPDTVRTHAFSDVVDPFE